MSYNAELAGTALDPIAGSVAPWFDSITTPMLNPKILRTDPDLVQQGLAKRHATMDLARYADMEKKRFGLQQQVESLQAERNALAKAVGQAKAKGESADALLRESTSINKQLADKEAEFADLQQQMRAFELMVPNLPDASVPEGKDDSANAVLSHWGEPQEYNFVLRDHIELAGADLDSETASHLSGSRFTLLWGQLARLHRALGQWMIDTHIQNHGYTEVYLPYVVNSEILVGSGQLPKFADDLFQLAHEDKMLIPTSEVPLANLVRERIVNPEELPLRFVAQTPCFRREAGSYGKDMRGIFRQHQFEKVELVQVTSPNRSWEAHEAMTEHAEAVLQALQLPYRRTALCGGDLGFAAAKTYDLEVWLPSQNQYREISSVSNCLDFQARRMQARWRNPDSRKTEYLHTLNGSGVAVGRCVIAVLENHQREDGSVAIPEPLWPYMGGATSMKLV